MKVQSTVLVVFTFVTSALADYATDLKINRTYDSFIDQFESLINRTSYDTAVQAYQAQQKAIGTSDKSDGKSWEEILQLSQFISSDVMSQFKPIAYEIIYNAGYNTKRNYLILNNTTNLWHLPNYPPPANPINGTAVNSRILGKELVDAFIQLIPDESQAARIKKRGFFFPSFSTNSFIRNAQHLSPAKVTEHIDDFLLKNEAALGKADHSKLNSLKKNADSQNKWRQDASKQLQSDLSDIDSNLDYFARKKKLEDLDEGLPSKDNYELKHGKDTYNKDKKIIKDELNKVNDLIQKEINRQLKWNIKRVASTLLMGLGAITVFSWMFSGSQENYESVPIDDFDFEDTESAGGSDFNPPENPKAGTLGFPGGSDIGSNSDTLSTGNNPQTPANPAQPLSTLNDQGLAKLIRNPDTGVTYYLDERVNKYYYVDATTKQSVYYS